MVSVIVPVYNVERYLRECVDSVLAQTLADFELLLVDDGSADASGQICDQYAAADARVRALHMPNGGPSAARNAGLKAAKGDLIAFVDSDDVVAPNYLAELVDAMRIADVDVACGGFSATLNWDQPSGRVQVVPGREAIRLTLLQRGYNSSPCKLFRRSLFDKEVFRQGIIYEDLDIICRLYERASKVARLDARLYYYRSTPGSIIHTFSARRFDVLEVTRRIAERYAGDAELAQAAKVRQFAANFNMFILASLHGGYESQRAQCWDMVRKLRGEALRAPARAKDKAGALLSCLGPRFALWIAKKLLKNDC